MSSFRKFIVFIMASSLILGSISLASDDFDIIDFLPAIIRTKKSNIDDLRKMFARYASDASNKIASQDRSQVVAAVNSYPDDWDFYGKFTGQALPLVSTDAQGKPQVYIANRADAFYLLGAKATFQGNRDIALWCFCEAARRVPQAATYVNNAAFALLEFGYNHDALQALEFAMSRAPDFLSLYVNLGTAQAAMGKYDQAAESFQKAFNAFPTNPDYCRLAAILQHQAGRDGQAYALAQVGKINFPTVYNWDAFLATLKFSPAPATWNCPDPNEVVLEFVGIHMPQVATEIGASARDYFSNVYKPAVERIDKDKEECFYSIMAIDCGYDECCSFTNFVLKNECFLNAYTARLPYEQNVLDKSLAAFTSTWAKLEADFDAIKGTLTNSQIGCIRYFMDGVKYSAYLSLNERIDSFNDTVKSILHYIKQGSEAIVMADDVCNKSPSPPVPAPDIPWLNWTLTGEITTGLEQSICVGPVCLGYDFVRREFSIDCVAGLGVQFTFNPFTHETGVNLGLGFEGGLGPFNFDGAIWLKSNKDGFKGVESKFNLLGLGANMKFLLGFEGLS